MPEKLPFANDIKSIAHQAALIIQPEFIHTLRMDIDRVIDRVEEESQGLINSGLTSLSLTQQAERFIEKYNTLPNRGDHQYPVVKVVGFMIETDHPFLKGWSEEHKRYFLDAAIEDEILRTQAEGARSERDHAYFRTRTETGYILHNEMRAMKIENFRTLQAKLRERASTTPPGRRK